MTGEEWVAIRDPRLIKKLRALCTWKDYTPVYVPWIPAPWIVEAAEIAKEFRLPSQRRRKKS